MGTEAQKREVASKVSKLVADRFGGDYQSAFAFYDSDQRDGRISEVELGQLLKDGGIGNWLTRDAWAEGIIAALDANQDGTISAKEFEAAIK